MVDGVSLTHSSAVRLLQVSRALEDERTRGADLLSRNRTAASRTPASFQGKDSILSGPAGGIVGMVRTALSAGFERVIGFGIWGVRRRTSRTSRARALADCEREFDTLVAGVRVRAKAQRCRSRSIAAGAACCSDSTGRSFPRRGPVRGREPWSGYIGRGGPPRRHGLQRDARQNPAAILSAVMVLIPSRRRLDRGRGAGWVRSTVCRRVHEDGAPRDSGGGPKGLPRIAVSNRRNARSVHLRSTPTTHELHARLLRRRRTARPCPGRGRARHGSGLYPPVCRRPLRVRHGARRRHRDARAGVRTPVGRRRVRRHDDGTRTAHRRCPHEVVAQGVSPAHLSVFQRAHLKYDGTDTALVVEVSDRHAMQADFASAYEKRFAPPAPERGIVIEALSVEVAAKTLQKVEASSRRRPRPRGVAETNVRLTRAALGSRRRCFDEETEVRRRRSSKAPPSSPNRTSDDRRRAWDARR